MTNQIFISVAEEDIGIAEALDNSINSFFGDKIKVLYYASEKPGCRIPQGEQWFEWILKEGHICDLALVLLTPSSIQKPWIFFESGFIYGMARAKKKRNNVVRPIIYALNDKEIPEQFSRLQFSFGGERDGVRKVFREILEQYSTIFNTHPSSEDIEKVITTYLELVEDSVLMAPLKKLKKEYLKANNIPILKDKQEKKMNLP